MTELGAQVEAGIYALRTRRFGGAGLAFGDDGIVAVARRGVADADQHLVATVLRGDVAGSPVDDAQVGTQIDVGHHVVAQARARVDDLVDTGEVVEVAMRVGGAAVDRQLAGQVAFDLEAVGRVGRAGGIAGAAEYGGFFERAVDEEGRGCQRGRLPDGQQAEIRLGDVGEPAVVEILAHYAGEGFARQALGLQGVFHSGRGTVTVRVAIEGLAGDQVVVTAVVGRALAKDFVAGRQYIA